MPNTFNEPIPTEVTENHPALPKDDWSHATRELMDSLPQVWTRGLLYFLFIFVAIVLPWAILSKVDETGTARGQLEPQGKTLKLDAPVSGKVAVINVKQGDAVKVGQSLLELESDLVKVELREQQTKLEGQQQRLHQLQILYNQVQLTFQVQQQQNKAQELEKSVQVNQARQNLIGLKNNYNLQKEEKLAQVNQVKQNLQHSRTASKLAEIQLKSSQREVKRYENAVQEGIVSQVQVVDKEDGVQERKRVYEQAKSDIEQAKLRLEEQKSSYQRTLQQANTDIELADLRLKEQENSYQSLVRSGEIAALKIQEQIRNLETEIISLKAEIKQSKSQIEGLQFQLSQRVIKAPVNGTVFHLLIEREGAVVQPGSRLAEIASQGTALILRAQMATNESGFLTEKMPVKIKFDAYPFQDYGIIEGDLIKVSPTTSEIETPQGKVAAYDLEIKLKQTCIPTPKECIKLRPGDTATAEVIVRQRRLIDFIIDPFKKLQKGGLKL